MPNILKLWAEGFGPYKNRQEFEFKPNTLTLITGRNGTGKSTFFSEALSFFWYNKPYRDLTVKDWVNEECQQCEVGMLLDDGGELIKIRDVDGTTSIFMYGEPATQDHLLNFIGNLDKDLFFNSIVFGQGFGGFVFLKDKDKKKFIMELSLGFLDKYFGSIEEVGDNYRARIADFESNIENIASELGYLNLSDLAKNFSMFNEQVEALLKQSTLDKADNESKLKNLSNQLSRKKQELSKLEKELAKIDDKAKEYRDLVGSIGYEISTFKERLRGADKNLLDFNDHVDDALSYLKCPICLRTMDRVTKNLVHSTFEKKIKAEGLVVQSCQVAIKGLEKRAKGAEAKLAELYKGQDDIIHKCNRLRDEITAFEKEQTALSLKLDAIDKEVYDVAQKGNPYEKLYKDALLKETKLKTEKLELERKLERTRNYYEVGLKHWESEFYKLRNDVFSGMLQSFEPLSNDYFVYISEGKYSVKFLTDIKVTKKSILDKFEIEVYKGDKKVGFNRLSQGEQRQLALSNNMALIQLLNLYVGGDSNFVIFDEVFDHLDNVAKDYVFTILDKLREETGKALVLITHDEFILDSSFKVDKIQVVNDGETSYFIKERNN